MRFSEAVQDLPRQELGRGMPPRAGAAARLVTAWRAGTAAAAT